MSLTLCLVLGLLATLFRRNLLGSWSIGKGHDRSHVAKS